MATFAKATIMFVTLVGIPAAWIYVGPLPASAQRAVDRFVARARQALQRSDAKSVQEEFAGSSHESGASVSEMPPARAIGDSAERFEPLLATLRRMGAVEYRLIRWGSAGEFYRFSCSMPFHPAAQSSGSSHLRQFEAISRDASASISQVVQDAMRWQTLRLASQGGLEARIASLSEEGGGERVVAR